MKHESQQPPDEAEVRKARLTAYALGQLHENETAQVQADLRAFPNDERDFEETKRLAAALTAAHAGSAIPEGCSSLRQSVLDCLADSGRPRKANRTKRRFGARRTLGISFGVAGGLAAAYLLFFQVPTPERLVARSEAEQARRSLYNGRINTAGKDSLTAGASAVTRQARQEAESQREGRSKDSTAGVSSAGANGSSPSDGMNWGFVPAAGNRAGQGRISQGGGGMGGRPAASGNASGGGMGGMDMDGGVDMGGMMGGMAGGGMGLGGGGMVAASPGGRLQGRGDDSVDSSAGAGGQAAQRPSRGTLIWEAETLGFGGRAKRRAATDVGRRFYDLARGPRYGLEPHPPATGNEQYEALVENRFLEVAKQPVSTFSIDVDTASYANVRRFLTQGQLPPRAAVRLEEMINYFSYEDPAPPGQEPFSATMEVAECPWSPGHRMVRMALKGKSVPRRERPPCNLVFLLDVSGSMADANKLPLLKQAMKLLVDQLSENDRVAIVTYAGQAGLQLDSISGDQHQAIRSAIDSLNASGSTNGSAGIQLAYQKAEQYFRQQGVNRVLLATDGDLNVGVTQDDALVELITSKAKSGVFLTVLGFGQGNLQDAKLEKLADNGNGTYAYIDSLREARRVLVEQMAGSLVTIAQDVKIKVEFNPAQVYAYRLIGYENRLLTPAEFHDDRKDAGEIGAGHSVTVLYEVIPTAAPRSAARVASGLKYQRLPEPEPLPATNLTEAASTGELLTLFLRFKQPGGTESTLREFVLHDRAQPFSSASEDFRFSSAVAAFGMLLRGSQFRGDATLAAVEEIASAALGDDLQGHRTEFLDLVRRAQQLGR